MMPVEISDRFIKLDIKDLPPNQQDRVIRFASELAKNLRQIRLVAEQQQKNENAHKSCHKMTAKAENNERK
jgi:mRNA-degrading endonuclease RelE of RelBE toxin-antitoxin system